VIYKFHKFKFPIGPLRVRHVLEGPAELLDGNVLLGDGVKRRTAEKKTRKTNEHQ